MQRHHGLPSLRLPRTHLNRKNKMRFKALYCVAVLFSLLLISSAVETEVHKDEKNLDVGEVDGWGGGGSGGGGGGGGGCRKCCHYGHCGCCTPQQLEELASGGSGSGKGKGGGSSGGGGKGGSGGGSGGSGKGGGSGGGGF